MILKVALISAQQSYLSREEKLRTTHLYNSLSRHLASAIETIDPPVYLCGNDKHFVDFTLFVSSALTKVPEPSQLKAAFAHADLYVYLKFYVWPPTHGQRKEHIVSSNGC